MSAVLAAVLSVVAFLLSLAAGRSVYLAIVDKKDRRFWALVAVLCAALAVAAWTLAILGYPLTGPPAP